MSRALALAELLIDSWRGPVAANGTQRNEPAGRRNPNQSAPQHVRRRTIGATPVEPDRVGRREMEVTL